MFGSMRLGLGLSPTKGGGAVDVLALLQSKGAAFFLHDFIGRTDLTWQDAAGQTAADGSGEAVALALGIDQIGDQTLTQVLAAQPELVTNGGFDDATGWTLGTGWTISSGQLSHVAGSATLATQTISLTSAKAYKATCDVVAVSGGTGSLQFRSGGTTTSATISDLDVGSTVELIYVADGNTQIAVFAGSATNITVDNISVKEIPGYHAVQAVNTSFRPTRQADGSVKGDRLDDNLLQRLTSSASMFMAAALLGASTPAATAAIIGGPVSTTRGYLSRDSAGKLSAGVGDDGPSTIVGGSDIAGLKGVAMLNIDASGNVDLEWMPKGGALVSLYSAPINGAVAAGTAMRLFATNPSGSPANFGGDSLYFATAIQTTLTPAERLALAKNWNARIPS